MQESFHSLKAKLTETLYNKKARRFNMLMLVMLTIICYVNVSNVKHNYVN